MSGPCKIAYDRIAAIVEGVTPGDLPIYPFRCAYGPLYESEQTRVFEVAGDGGPVDEGLTGTEPILWTQRAMIRVRYEPVAPADHADLLRRISEDQRRIIRAVRLPSAWMAHMNQLTAGLEPAVVTVTLDDAEQVASITCEIPITIQFFD